jgi:hypothetical protein
MNKNIDKIIKEFNLEIEKIDIDSTSLKHRYSINYVPTILFLDNEKEKSRIEGFVLIKPLRHYFRNL